MEREWVAKFRSGEYLEEWNGFTPFYAGCFYGDGVCLGGEEKFSHCYDFFSGIGDVDWWIASELDALCELDKAELLAILKRNKNANDYVHSNSEGIRELASRLKLEGTSVIYRLKNKNILRILESADPASEFYNIMEELDKDPVTGNPLNSKPVDRPLSVSTIASPTPDTMMLVLTTDEYKKLIRGDEFDKIRAQIRNLLSPMLGLSSMVLDDSECDIRDLQIECAKQVKSNVNRILKVLERNS